MSDEEFCPRCNERESTQACKEARDHSADVLWEHYRREEMPLKEISTQDAYLVYGKNWILPRWGSLLLEDIKTIEVERWLRAAEIADGTKAKILDDAFRDTDGKIGFSFANRQWPHEWNGSGLPHGAVFSR